MSTRDKGSNGENLALEYLLNQNYLFIGRNFYVKGGELDLIMQENEFLVFVEVKSIKENSNISIYETLNKKKKRRLKNSINKWLYINNKIEATWRFDFVGIVVDNYYAVKTIEHFKFVGLEV